MRKTVSTLFVCAGIFLLALFGYEWYGHYAGAKQALDVAEQVVAKQVDVTTEEEIEPFEPEMHEVIGLLTIPKIDAKLPVVEGTDEEQLEVGVGHYVSTALPGGDEQILFSGHRDTVFRNFGEIEVGDRFIVDMPYGTFEYEMRDYEIVDMNNTGVIREMGEEVLTLSTCYPFGYIGPAPNRYVIYAYPVE